MCIRDSLKLAVAEKDSQVSSLKTQVSSFQAIASAHHRLEKQQKEQSKKVTEWRGKIEAAEVSVGMSSLGL